MIEFNGNKQTTDEMKQVVIDEEATFGGKVPDTWYCRKVAVKDEYDKNQNKTGNQFTLLELLPPAAVDALLKAKQDAVIDSMVPVLCEVDESLAAKADDFEKHLVKLVPGKYHVVLKNTASVKGINTSYKFDTFQLVAEAGGVDAEDK